MEEAMVAQYDLLGTVRERSAMPKWSILSDWNIQTKDEKWAIIVCSTNPVFWHLCEAMDRPDWRPKYDLAKARLADPDPIMNAVTEWVASHTFAELKEKCDKAGVPISSVYSMKDIFEDPQYALAMIL